MATIEEVVARHRELKAELAHVLAQQAEITKPINEKIEKIEMWLLAKMNQDGVQNYKTPAGTAYLSHLTSVKLDEPTEFKNFILRPAAQWVIDLVQKMGVQVPDPQRDVEAVLSAISTLALWDLADFRPGKKGITAYIAENKKGVPGVTLNEIVNVNVRGS